MQYVIDLGVKMLKLSFSIGPYNVRLVQRIVQPVKLMVQPIEAKIEATQVSEFVFQANFASL